MNRLVYSGFYEKFYTDDDLTNPVMSVPRTLTANVQQIEIHGKIWKLFIDQEETSWLGLCVKRLIGHIELDSTGRINYELNYQNDEIVLKVEKCEAQRESVIVKKTESYGAKNYEIESSTGQRLNLNGGDFYSMAGGTIFSTYGLCNSHLVPTVTFLSAVALCQIYLRPLETGTMA